MDMKSEVQEFSEFLEDHDLSEFFSEKMVSKTIVLNDFDKEASNYLSQLVWDKLAEKGISPTSFTFSIEVDYQEQE
jgi:hypothetical protein